MRILLVGVSVRAFAESALRSGFDIAALDAFGDLDLRLRCKAYGLSRDFQMPYHAANLLQASRELHFDAVAYTADLENHPEVLTEFACQKTLLGNPPQVVSRVRDWRQLFDVLSGAGFCVPETIGHGEPLRANGHHPWLRKPARGGGGHGISMRRNDRRPGRGYLLQEYIEGIPCSAAFIANGREAVVIGLTEQLIGRPEFGAQDFRYCGNVLPLDVPADMGSLDQVFEQVQAIASLLTREFALVGANGMDFILKDGLVFLTEVNPRYSASMELVERADRLPVFGLHIQAVTKGRLPVFNWLESRRYTIPRYYGKAILFAGEDGAAPDTQKWLGRGLRDIPHPGENLKKGKPVCTLLADGTTRDECFDRLSVKAAAVEGEIYEGSKNDFNHRPVYKTRNGNLNR